MDFSAIRTQVIALLQREGRARLSRPQTPVPLDDDHLEDLKDELIYAKRLAVDEDGRVLVWTGMEETRPPPQSAPRQPSLPGAPSPAPPTPDAERRQLTVLFCDLVDSTQPLRPARPGRPARGRARLSRHLRQGDRPL